MILLNIYNLTLCVLTASVGFAGIYMGATREARKTEPFGVEDVFLGLWLLLFALIGVAANLLQLGKQS